MTLIREFWYTLRLWVVSRFFIGFALVVCAATIAHAAGFSSPSRQQPVQLSGDMYGTSDDAHLGFGVVGNENLKPDCATNQVRVQIGSVWTCADYVDGSMFAVAPSLAHQGDIVSCQGEDCRDQFAGPCRATRDGQILCPDRQDLGGNSIGTWTNDGGDAVSCATLTVESRRFAFGDINSSGTTRIALCKGGSSYFIFPVVEGSQTWALGQVLIGTGTNTAKLLTIPTTGANQALAFDGSDFYIINVTTGGTTTIPPATTTTVAAATTTTIAPPTYEDATNCASSMVALYRLEESTGSSATDSGPNGYTLTDGGGSVVRTTTSGEYKEGSAAATFSTATGMWLSCTTANCPLLNQSGGDFSIWAWGRPTSLSNTRSVVHKDASSQGYYVSINTSGNLGCRFSGTTATATAGMSAGNYYGLYCGFDSAEANEIQAAVYSSGAPTTASADKASWATSNSTFYLATNTSTPTNGAMVGQIDEVAIDDAAWSSSERARFANCGIRGELCRCDGSTPANYLSCSTNADCRVDTGSAVCDGGTCKGRGATTDTMAACNAACP